MAGRWVEAQGFYCINRLGRDRGWTLGREIAPDMLDAQRPSQRCPKEHDRGRISRSLRFHVRQEELRRVNVHANIRPNFPINRMAIKAPYP